MVIEPIFLLAPFFVLGAYIGYQRGWLREAYTALGLLLVIVLFSAGSGGIVGALNAIIERLRRVATVAVSDAPPSPGPPALVVPPTLEPIVSLLLLCLFIALAYWAGLYYTRTFKPDNVGRLLGLLIGGLNLSLVAWRIYLALRESGLLPANFGGLRLNIPSFTGVNIILRPPPETVLQASWPIGVVAVLILLLLLAFIVRLARS